MDFQNCKRNRYGKCDIPANTVERIKEGFARLGLKPEYAPVSLSENIHWGRAWIDSIRIVCNGKGITPELARASAYAELAERFSAGLFYPVFEQEVRFNVPALYDEATSKFLNHEWMDGYRHAHQDDLGHPLKIEELLADETHLTREDIAEIEDSRMAHHWVDGISLISGDTIQVPINFVTYIHASNGIAAGNTLEEALIQASCEIFERHAQIETIRPERVVPSIHLDSVENDGIRGLVDFYERNNVEVIIKDLSFDGLLPALGAFFINRNLKSDRLEHKILIPAVSFNLDEALSRCFTEGMQGRDTLLTPRPQLDRPVVHRSQVDNFYLLMKCGISLKDISFLERGETKPYRNRPATDILSEIEQVKQICRRLDTDLILLDQTHPILDFPVVRVLMPRISDFLPFLKSDILISEATKPSAQWRGGEFAPVMQSFFPS